MRFRFSWTAAAIVLSMALLPVKAGGCGKTICLQAQKGVCPSRDGALSFFTDNCGGVIESVDGEPSFDGQLCCYPVTEISNNFDSFGCIEPGDVGGGFSTGGFGGFGGGGCDEFGACGGTGGGGGCITCLDQLNNGPVPTDLMCPTALTPWLELSECGCKVGCPETCIETLCANTVIDDVCSSCLQSSCEAEFFACVDN